MDFQTITGLVFLYAMVSSVCSGINEWLNATLKSRPKLLARGIVALLPDAYGKTLIEDILKGPIISGVAPPSKKDKVGLPSYLDSSTVVDALIEYLVPANPGGPTRTVADLAAKVQAMPSGATRTILANFLDQAESIDVFKQRVATYYDEAMNRVTGVFKRNSQLRIAAIALVVCGAFNIDANNVVSSMNLSRELRDNENFSSKNFLDRISAKSNFEVNTKRLAEATAKLESLTKKKSEAEGRAKTLLEEAKAEIPKAEAKVVETTKALDDIKKKTDTVRQREPALVKAVTDAAAGTDEAAKKKANEALAKFRETDLLEALQAEKTASSNLTTANEALAKAKADSTKDPKDLSPEVGELTKEIEATNANIKKLSDSLEQSKKLVSELAPLGPPAVDVPAAGAPAGGAPAPGVVGEEEVVRQQLANLNQVLRPLHSLPIGFDLDDHNLIRKILGILMSAVIVTMLAPFSFDIVNLLTNGRATGIKPKT